MGCKTETYTDCFNCFRCGDEICLNTEQVSDGYFGVCLTCDEDMYKFECLT